MNYSQPHTWMSQGHGFQQKPTQLTEMSVSFIQNALYLSSYQRLTESYFIAVIGISTSVEYFPHHPSPSDAGLTYCAIKNSTRIPAHASPYTHSKKSKQINSTFLGSPASIIQGSMKAELLPNTQMEVPRRSIPAETYATNGETSIVSSRRTIPSILPLSDSVLHCYAKVVQLKFRQPNGVHNLSHLLTYTQPWKCQLP